jgi:hypothetical protein
MELQLDPDATPELRQAAEYAVASILEIAKELDAPPAGALGRLVRLYAIEGTVQELGERVLLLSWQAAVSKALDELEQRVRGAA